MNRIYQSLLLLIAGATNSELARQLKFLKVENETLRVRLPKRLLLSAKERSRLVMFAKHIKAKVLEQLTSIVHPGTLLRWIRSERQQRKRPAANVGRRKTVQQIRELILRIGRATGWGYTRIMGELKKLEVRCPCRNTVKAIMKAAGLDPGPKRGEGTWDDFLKRHAASLWQCDFISRKVLTLSGFRFVFLLVFLNVKTRRVIVTPSVHQPDAAWMETQTRAFVEKAREDGLPVSQVICDRDLKFSSAFDDTLRQLHVRPKRTEFRAPNMNAYVERFIQSLQQECLDEFVILGTEHLDHLVSEYVDYYHTCRPHQGLDNEILIQAKRDRRKKVPRPADTISLAEVRCEERLGGLLKSFVRKAA